MPKKKVLIVHNYYQIPGGEDTVVASEKKMLEDHGHEVTLYTRNNSEINKLTKWQKVLLPVSTVFNYQVYKEIKEIIKKEAIDVVHVHNTLNMISPSVYYAALKSHVPVVQTIHNFRLLCPAATFYRDGHVCEDCLKRGLLCAVKHSCYRESKVQTMACVVSTWIHRLLGVYGKLNYICLTQFNKEKLLNLKQIKEEKVFVKPNSVSAMSEIVPLKDREPVFTYVGRLDKIKGVDILLKAWNYLGMEAPRLVVCGTGPLEDWCKKYVEEHQLRTVELLGFVPNDEVKKLIGQAKALILPTQWYEGFPMTIVEAYACGTPVIGSDLGNTGSVIEIGKNGWKFDHTSFEDLAETIREFLEKFDSFDTAYIDLYSLETNYLMLEKIYNSI